jgi:hypothetical protein
MRKLLVAALLLTVFAGPAFAAKKPHQHKQKNDYRYHAPKIKTHKNHIRNSHSHSAPQHAA